MARSKILFPTWIDHTTINSDRINYIIHVNIHDFMRMSNDDFILYCVYELKDKNHGNLIVSQDEFAKILNVGTKTLSKYLTDLSNKKMITRHKRHFEKNYVNTIEITNKGYDCINTITKRLDDSFFLPDRHQTKSCISVNKVFKEINNPLERIFLLRIYVKNNTFNVNDYLNNISTINNDFNIIGQYKILEKDNNYGNSKPLNYEIFNMSLYGDNPIDLDKFNEKGFSESNVNPFLIHAETMRKQGKYDYALNIYKTILSLNEELNQNQWFIANLGIAQVYRRMGRIDDAFDQLEMISRETKNKKYLAILKYIQGIYRCKNGEYEKALKLLSSCIVSFNNFRIDLFISMAHNSRGVVYFSIGKIKHARKDWTIARRYANSSKSDYAKAWVYVNLADLEIQDHNIKRASSLLNKAKKIFKEKKDDEGLVNAEFNFSLVELAKRNYDVAVEHMNTMRGINKGITCPLDVKIFYSVFNERAKKYGFPPLENHI